MSKKLLKKLVLITANFNLTFLPLVISFSITSATKAEINDNAELAVLAIFEIGLLLNPILIYLLDAKMKQSINEILGITKIMSKKNPQLIPQAAAIEMKAPVIRVNVLQLHSPAPMSPIDTHQSPNNIRTVLLTHTH